MFTWGANFKKCFLGSSCFRQLEHWYNGIVWAIPLDPSIDIGQLFIYGGGRSESIDCMCSSYVTYKCIK